MHGRHQVPYDSEDVEDKLFASVSYVYAPSYTHREFIFSQIKFTGKCAPILSCCALYCAYYFQFLQRKKACVI
jgi:hypothetical protein